MTAQEADLMSIGKHCAYQDCRQIDFLPFRCSRCAKVYCLDHRVCPCNQSEDTVLACPLCAKAVVCPSGQDPELVFDRHTRTDCDPSNYDRVHRKQRCPVGGCKEKLTAINSYTCRECEVTVCLKHRLATDHKCAGRASATATSAQGRLLSQSWRCMFSSSSAAAPVATGGAAPRQQQQQQRPQVLAAVAAASSSSQWPTGAQKAAAVASRTKESFQSQLQQYRRQQRGWGQPIAGAGTAAVATGAAVDLSDTSPAAGGGGATLNPSGPEVCQCGACFSTVEQLIQHAETAHAGGWSSGSIDMEQQCSAGLDRCPHCGREFADAVQLVAHVEHQHAAAGGTCVLC